MVWTVWRSSSPPDELQPWVRVVEAPESRVLLSGANLTAEPTFINSGPAPSSTILSPSTGSGTLSAPFSPAQIDSAYGVNGISFSGVAGDGSGQTIAIADAYNDPNIMADTAAFNTRFSLPQFNVAGGPTFTVLNQNGSAGNLPGNATPGVWDIEESLDVQWAHAIAPQANIVLFEANSANESDLFDAVTTAAGYGGVCVVSMSWTEPEYSGEAVNDIIFQAASGHPGVTFLASTGDSGEPAAYPAASPDVVAVGGTTLTINSDGSYGGEVGWSGSGGGISAYESQPAYQNGNVSGISSTYRTTPDVSMDANPSSGVYVMDSYDGGGSGGTRLAAPA